MERPTPRADDNDRPADTPRRRRDWKPDPLKERALDDHIRSRWGDEYTWRRWRRR